MRRHRNSARSKVEALSPELKAAVDARLARGDTYADIVADVNAQGGDISHSSVGRYAQNYSALVEHQRGVGQAIAQFGEGFGRADDPAVRLMVQLANTIASRSMLEMVNTEAELSTKQLGEIARAAKDTAAAYKIVAEAEEQIRANERERTAKAAAEVAEDTGRRAGATAETIAAIKRDILGLAA